MIRARPYLFCRYSLFIDEEPLDSHGQVSALQELQGDVYPDGPAADRVGRRDSFIARPEHRMIGGEEIVTWTVGRLLEPRVGLQYDNIADKLKFVEIDDSTVKVGDFIAIPRLGAVAVDDRTTESFLGAKGAIKRLRSIFTHLEGGAANIEYDTSSQDVEHAFKNWTLQEVSFKVRPSNPHSRTQLSQEMTDALVAEGIYEYSAKAVSGGGKVMKPGGGPIDAAIGLSDDGYGQYGVRARTPDGHLAQIKRPAFTYDKDKNLKVQDRPRDLRVFVEPVADADDSYVAATVKALIEFYDR